MGGRPETLQERFSRLVEQVTTRTFPYEPKEPRSINWAKYTEAQVRELNDTLVLIRRTVDAVNAPLIAQPTGRPRENLPPDLAKVLLLQGYFNCSNRLASGYAQVFREKLGISRDLNYKAIERAYEDPTVILILRTVFERTQRPEKGHTEGFSLDGSGLPRDMKGNWERDKLTPQAKRERFDGAVATLTLPGQLITGWVSHPVGFASESPTLAPLVAQTLRHYGRLNGVFTADAAFLSRDNCALIEAAGAQPRLFPKRGIRYQRQGVNAWARMHRALLTDPPQWLREYHQRSLAESVWSRHKRRHPTPLRKRITLRRETEKATRFTADNLTRLSTLSHTAGRDLKPLWSVAA